MAAEVLAVVDQEVSDFDRMVRMDCSVFVLVDLG